jgi:hypothetical protein
MGFGVPRVEDDQYPGHAFGSSPYLAKDRVRGRGAGEVGNPRMPGAIFSPIHVNRQDLSEAQEVADGGKEQGAATLIGPCFDNQLWLHLVQNLLVRPEIEWALEHPVAQPECIPPGLFATAVVERVELVNE